MERYILSQFSVIENRTIYERPYRRHCEILTLFYVFVFCKQSNLIGCRSPRKIVIKNFANNLYVFFLLTTYKSYSGTKMDTGEKSKPPKSANKYNDSDVQSKADSDENGDSETVIGKAPPKTKTFFAFFDGFAKFRARDKWILCLDAETHMYVCEYCK